MEIRDLIMAQLKNTTINDTGFLQLPNGTTAQRQASPANGMMRYNTTLSIAEWYDAEYAAWYPTGYLPPIATGGTVATVGGYRIHTFTIDYFNISASGGTINNVAGTRNHTFSTVGSSTFVLNSAEQSDFTVTRGGEVEYLIVAGGGAGGNCQGNSGLSGSGAGGGGVLFGTMLVTPQVYPVIVGQGGAATNSPFVQGANGQNSSVFGLTAFGGGAGGSDLNTNRCATGSSTSERRRGCPGGSGGGSGVDSPAGIGTAGQGNPGGSGGNSGGGGGGGGAGTAGFLSGDGGVGLSTRISGANTFYAGGGGAGGNASVTGRQGGLGGGGRGINFQEGNIISAANGVNGTGGGGGGTPANQGVELFSGAGGSGIVIIRYRIA